MAKHELGDMELIRANLQHWMRATIAGAEQLVLGELSFPETSGESSVSLILKGQNRGESVKYVCRMKPQNSEVFDEHDLLLQYQLMTMVGENDIPMPPLLGLEENESLLGSDFFLMGFVDGQIPADNPPYAFGSWVTDLSEDERGTMWRNGLATLAGIHQIDLDAYDVSGIPVSAKGTSPVQHELDKFNALITDEIRGRMSPILEHALRYINDNAPVDGVRRLCWGDARVGNVIWEDLQPKAVIDWEMACIGDPVQDVSWWYWIDYVNSVGFGLARLSGLPSLGDIYAQWQSLTGLPLDHTDYYDLFALVRYAIILERKFLAMEKAGLGTIENFALPMVEQQLAKCELT
jgi:aminoglycoside phosphotransferase (APT) family kinase protein